MLFAVLIVSSLSICALRAAPVNHGNFVDLTHPYHNETLHYPISVPFQMYVTSNGTEDFGFWVQMEHYRTDTHVGTHIDAPCHFAEGKWCVDQIPIERLIAQAIVVDISAKAEQDPDYMLAPQDLEEWERTNGQIPNGTVLLVRTGWAKRWPDKHGYLGTDDNDVAKLHFPSIHPDAAQWLVDNRNIIGIGLDSLSVDSARTSALLSHRILYDENIYGLENMGVMDALPVNGTTLWIMPMKIKNASGAPCRILAQLPE